MAKYFLLRDLESRNQNFNEHTMKQILYPSLVFMMIMLSGCQAIADIFKAGVWVGIIIVVVIIFLIIFIIGKAKK